MRLVQLFILFATNQITSRYFLRKLRKVKKANGQILAVNEIFEKRPTTIKNYGIWVRYTSRTGVHNMYKEFRDLTLNGAVYQMYEEMGSRHRVRTSALQIIKTATIKASQTKRPAIKQFHDSKIKFPITRRLARYEVCLLCLQSMGWPSSPTFPPSVSVFSHCRRASDRKYKTVFKASRPNVAIF